MQNKFLKFIILFFLSLQFLIWVYCQSIKTPFQITPLPPSNFEKSIFSFGDKEFLYRYYGMQIQMAGDTFGQTIPLKDYDYIKLEKWFYSLLELNSISQYVPSIAGLYYSQSQNPLDNKYIVNFLFDYASKDPEKNWRWYIDSAFLMKTKLKDFKRASVTAAKVMELKNKDIPKWAKVFGIFVAADDKDPCFVLDIMKNLNQKDLEALAFDDVYSADQGQHNFLLNIIIDRIEKLKKDRQALDLCLKRK
jgi:hypothetical protein